MAERAVTITKVGSLSMGVDCFVAQWTGLLNGDTGEAVDLGGVGDRSVEVYGTFGAAGNLRFKGSNSKVNYYVLTDPQGNALDFTAAKIEQVLEATRSVKPEVTAGDGTTDLTVTLFLRRSR